MIKRMDHLAVAVSDLEQSLKFYTEILGFEETLRFESKLPGIKRISFVRLGETTLELIEMENSKEFQDDPAMPGFKHLCLEVDDFDAEFDRLKQAGIKVLEEPHVLNEEHLNVGYSAINVDMKKGLKRAVFADPDGLPIEILKWL